MQTININSQVKDFPSDSLLRAKDKIACAWFNVHGCSDLIQKQPQKKNFQRKPCKLQSNVVYSCKLHIDNRAGFLKGPNKPIGIII